MLEVKNLKFRYTDKELFNSANFKLFPKEHIVLVGKNGTGKSTFMNLIARNLIPDSGSIEWLPHIKVGYLDQHLKIKSDVTIAEFLYKVFDELFEKERQMEECFQKLAVVSEHQYDQYLNRGISLQEELEKQNFYGLKSQIGNVTNGLGITAYGLDTPLKHLSGGQKAKVFLGKLLLENPDCLLMDEPTNFLDVSHIEWLTKYLQSFPGSFIVISHDEEFARKIGTVVYELSNGKLERYKGDFDFFLRERDIRNQQYERDYQSQQKFIKQTEEFIAKNIVRATTTKQAQSRRKVLEKLDIIDKPLKDVSVTFHFPFSRDLGQEVLRVKNLEIGYQKPLLPPINFIIRKNQKVAITGHNGIGKSTLLKTIIGDLSALSGQFEFIYSADINYYRQEEFYQITKPIDYVREFYPSMTDGEIRSLLAKVGLRADALTKHMTELSGGQQTKIRIALLTQKKANVLIFDEPTNHLDVVAKEALLEAFQKFPGCIILVSHDKAFYQAFADVEIDLEQYER